MPASDPEALRESLSGEPLWRALEAAAQETAGRPLDRLRCLRALVATAEAPAPDRARWAADLSSQLEDLDRLEEAADAAGRAVEAARSAGDVGLEARLLNRAGTLHHARGRHAEALAAYERSLALKDAQGDGRGAWNTVVNLATLRREMGEPSAALEAARRAGQLAGTDARKLAQSLALAAHAALEAGRPVDSLAPAREAFRALADVEGEALLLLDHAVVHARRGDARSARALLDQIPAHGVSRPLATRAQALRERLQPSGGRALLDRLLELNRALLARRDGAALLRDIVDAAVDLLAAERGFCILAAADGFDVAAARHVNRETIDRPQFKISRTIADRVARLGEPLRTEHAMQDPALQNLRSVAELHIKSICCAPLRAAGRVIGALYVDHRERAGAFGPEDLDTLQALADHAAVALTHARLEEETARQQKALEQLNAALRSANRALHQRVETQTRLLERAESARTGRDRYDQLIGRSAAMQDVYKLLDRLESSQETVLITGESGTGKELLARAIHHRSPRQGKPFVSINCGALAETLLESELFGHVKGAFTGAAADRAGVFEQAEGGTLFLDEIGEVSPDTQKRLLRVLQEREIRRVGDNRDRKVNVRVVAATNRDLAEAVEEKSFREDLYYRLNVLRIHLPPLRERKDDVPLLVAHFLDRIAAERGGPAPRIGDACMTALAGHGWPGNVRQLENAVRRIVALGEDALALEEAPATAATAAAPDLRPLEEVELDHIKRVLTATGGNVTEAARILGIGSATLWRRLKKHDLR
jgi:transcriptional regulator with GAF, ATPase, and Fis domain